MSSTAREAAQTIDTIYEISQILDCGLDKETLSILVSLCESGVNPEALAAVVKELRREQSAQKQRPPLAPHN